MAITQKNPSLSKKKKLAGKSLHTDNSCFFHTVTSPEQDPQIIRIWRRWCEPSSSFSPGAGGDMAGRYRHRPSRTENRPETLWNHPRPAADPGKRESPPTAPTAPPAPAGSPPTAPRLSQDRSRCFGAAQLITDGSLGHRQVAGDFQPA